MSYAVRQSLQITPESFRAWQSTSTTQQVSSTESMREQLRLARQQQDAAWVEAKGGNPEFAAQVPVTQTSPREEQSIVGTQRGDLAAVPDIDLCGFMSSLPDDSGITIDTSQVESDLNKIFASIQGITLPAVTFISDTIDGVVGTIDTAVGDLGAAVQSQIPKLSCGKKPITTETVDEVVQLGSALVPPSEADQAPAAVEPPPYGTQPTIVIDSPEVTVDALDDQIDLGEF